MPAARRFLARLDDWLGYGKRNPVKKWWFDLTIREGKVTVAGVSINATITLRSKARSP